MIDGLQVTFRQMLPQEELLELVMEEVAELQRYADSVKCRVVIQSESNGAFDASVVVGTALDALRMHARDDEPEGALRRAFAQLRAQVAAAAPGPNGPN